MRIGTWNIAGRSSPSHIDFARNLQCDVLLLTEVNDRFNLDGHHETRSSREMARNRRWAAVVSTAPMTAIEDPHPASAAARIGGITFCSSILPWRSCGSSPWGEGNHAARTQRTLAALAAQLPREDLVWGGDFNHSFVGSELAGSIAGRRAIADFAADRGLAFTTADLPHRLDEVWSIDHVAVPTTWTLRSATRHDATGLSDHDAYVVEVEGHDLRDVGAVTSKQLASSNT